MPQSLSFVARAMRGNGLPFWDLPEMCGDVLCQRNGSVSFQDRRDASLLWQPALQGARKNMSNMAEGPKDAEGLLLI